MDAKTGSNHPLAASCDACNPCCCYSLPSVLGWELQLYVMLENVPLPYIPAHPCPVTFLPSRRSPSTDICPILDLPPTRITLSPQHLIGPPPVPNDHDPSPVTLLLPLNEPYELHENPFLKTTTTTQCLLPPPERVKPPALQPSLDGSPSRALPS